VREREIQRDLERVSNVVCSPQPPFKCKHNLKIITSVLLIAFVTSEKEENTTVKDTASAAEACHLPNGNDTALKNFVSCKPVFVF
jgi:hypothetical protein